jgi:hypothetical protein
MTEALKILPYELIADDGSANKFTGVKFVNPDQGGRDRGIIAVRQARSTRNMQHPGADCAIAACCAWEKRAIPQLVEVGSHWRERRVAGRPPSSYGPARLNALEPRDAWPHRVLGGVEGQSPSAQRIAGWPATGPWGPASPEPRTENRQPEIPHGAGSMGARLTFISGLPPRVRMMTACPIEGKPS